MAELNTVEREERRLLCEEVEKLRETGINQQEACEKAGINYHTYKNLRSIFLKQNNLTEKRKYAKKAEPYVETTVLSDEKTKEESKVMVIVGTPEQLKDLVGKYI